MTNVRIIYRINFVNRHISYTWRPKIRAGHFFINGLDFQLSLTGLCARVILNTKLREERTMTLFKKLKWIPFTDELKINKCCMVSKSLNELAPSYVAEKFVTVSQISSRLHDMAK